MRAVKTGRPLLEEGSSFQSEVSTANDPPPSFALWIASPRHNAVSGGESPRRNFKKASARSSCVTPTARSEVCVTPAPRASPVVPATAPPAMMSGLYGLKSPFRPVATPSALTLEEKLDRQMHRANGFGVQLARRQALAAKLRAENGEGTLGLLQACRIFRKDESCLSPRRLRTAFNPKDHPAEYVGVRALPIRFQVLQIAPELQQWERAALDVVRQQPPPPSPCRRGSSPPFTLLWCKPRVASEKEEEAEPPPVVKVEPKITEEDARAAMSKTCRLKRVHPSILESIRASENALFCAGVRLVLRLAEWWAGLDDTMSLMYFSPRRDGSPYVGRMKGLLERLFTEEVRLKDLHDDLLSKIGLALGHLNLQQLAFLRDQLPLAASGSPKVELRNIACRLEVLMAELLCTWVLKREGGKVETFVFVKKGRRNSACLSRLKWETDLGHGLQPHHHCQPPSRLSSVASNMTDAPLRRGSMGFGALLRSPMPSMQKSRSPNTVGTDQKTFKRALSRRATRRATSALPGGILDSFNKVERQAIGKRLVHNLGVFAHLKVQVGLFLGTCALSQVSMTSSVQSWWYVPISDCLTGTASHKLDKQHQSGLFFQFPALIGSLKRPPEQTVYQLRLSMPASNCWDVRQLPPEAELTFFQPSSPITKSIAKLHQAAPFTARRKDCDSTAFCSEPIPSQADCPWTTPKKKPTERLSTISSLSVDDGRGGRPVRRVSIRVESPSSFSVQKHSFSPCMKLSGRHGKQYYTQESSYVK